MKLSNIARLDFYSKIVKFIYIGSPANFIGFYTKTQYLFCSYKMKRLLTDIELGMFPSKVWTGKFVSISVYLVVKGANEAIA
jgi:type II restriction enzyme